MKAIFVPLLIFLLAQTSWPAIVIVNKYDLVRDPLSIVIVGSICLLTAALGPFLVFRCHFSSRVDPLMYVFSVFSWTCMIGLGIALEVDGFISNYIRFYLEEAEQYLVSAHCQAINYWDGFVNFPLYLGAIGLYAARKSHREVGLFWAGSLTTSMFVLISGAVTVFVFSFATFQFQSIWSRPIDFMFVVYFVAAIGVAAFRGLTVLGGNAHTMQYYIKNVEPYLFDPSNFPRSQILVWEHFFLAYYLAAIYGLIYPGQHWMTDWSLLHAGAAAQGQFSHILGSIHHMTPKPLRAPMAGTPGLIFWTINITLAIVPQLFTWRCLSQFKMFGLAHNVNRAELKQPSVNNQSTKKAQ